MTIPNIRSLDLGTHKTCGWMFLSLLSRGDVLEKFYPLVAVAMGVIP